MEEDLKRFNCKIIGRIRSDVFKVTYSGAAYHAILKPRKIYPDFTIPLIKDIGENKYTLISPTISPLVADDNKPFYKVDQETIDLIDRRVIELHRKGIIHGDLTAKNIFRQGTKIYFTGLKDFEIGSSSWEQELELREKARSLQELANQDFTRWREDMNIKDKAATDVVKDYYSYRFIVPNYHLELNKDFAATIRAEFSSLCNVYIIKRKKTEYYFAKFVNDFYFDMTGIYRDLEGVKQMSRGILAHLYSEEDDDDITSIHEAKLEYTETPEILEESLYLVINHLKENEAPIFPSYASDSALYIGSNSLDMIYSDRQKIKERIIHKYSVEGDSDLLKILDIEAVTGFSPLSASLICPPSNPERFIMTSHGKLGDEILIERELPLIELSLKTNPWWMSQLFLYSVTNPAESEKLTWFYKMLARHREQTKILLDNLLDHWNVHYTYILTLIRAFVSLPRVEKIDEKLLEDLVLICLDKSYYDIILTFKKNIVIESILKRLDPYLLNVNKFSRESLNTTYLEPLGPMIPVGVREIRDRNNRQHYLRQRKNVTEEECIDIIKNKLDVCDILCIINDASEMWKKTSIANALNNSIQSYPAEVQARIALQSYKYMDSTRLWNFKMRLSGKENDYITKKTIKI